jgi:hypothetical protein
MRTYSELHRFQTFEERFNYLRLEGSVGAETFGFDRYLNQDFYRSYLWRRARDLVIARDYGRDLGITGYEIYGKIYVHHMNPMTPEDIKHSNLDIINPEYLISVTHETHNAIHYGDQTHVQRKQLVVRRPGDTKLW